MILLESYDFDLLRYERLKQDYKFIKAHRGVVRDRLHTFFVRKHLTIIRLMHLMFILCYICNLGALFITDYVTTASYERAVIGRAVYVQYGEFNVFPQMVFNFKKPIASITDFKDTIGTSKDFLYWVKFLFKHLLLWVFFVWVYTIYYRSVYNKLTLYTYLCFVFGLFVIVTTDLVHDVALLLGSGLI